MLGIVVNVGYCYELLILSFKMASLMGICELQSVPLVVSILV